MTTSLISGSEQARTYSTGLPTFASGSTAHTPSSPVGGGLFLIPRGSTWDAWELATSLMVTLSTSSESWLATTYLETDIPEYGAGASQKEAIADLLTSLSDYRESLEGREERLGPPAVGDLTKLRTLLQPRPQR
jgi:hypothetical protein